ncbi:MAG: DMT family transporter [Gammaproteobacteria bacterium]
MVGMRMDGASWLMLLLLSLLWGGSFFFIGVVVDALPPLTIVVLRVALAALTLNLVLRMTGERLPAGGAAWRAFLGMGLLNNAIPFTLIVWGQGHIASGLASILNAITPIFAVIVAHLFTHDEKMSVGRVAGIVVGFVGVVIVIGPSALEGLGVHVLAQLAILGAGLCYAFAGVFGRRFARLGITPLSAATGQVTASSVMLLPLALWVDRPWQLPIPGVTEVGAILALAVLSTALAYILYFRILATSGATNILLVTFLVPVSAVALGALFLGERLAVEHFVGVAVIGLGLACIDGRLWDRLRKRQGDLASEA